MLEAVDAATDVCGADRLGLHISPGDHEHSREAGRSPEDNEYVMREVAGAGLPSSARAKRLTTPAVAVRR
jgi:hypothetical protein